MKKYSIIIFVAITIIVAGLSFEGGILYQKNKASNSIPSGMPTGMAIGNTSTGDTSNRNGTPPSGTAPTGMGGGGETSGTVVSKDDESITIKTADGSSMVIYYSDSTTVTKSATASISDLTTGSEITIMGSTNSDKSITAKEIIVK